MLFVFLIVKLVIFQNCVNFFALSLIIFNFPNFSDFQFCGNLGIILRILKNLSRLLFLIQDKIDLKIVFCKR